MGPYTLQVGIWGFQEIMQVFNNKTLTFPDAQPQGWEVIKDDCYNAPYAGNFEFFYFGGFGWPIFHPIFTRLHDLFQHISFLHSTHKIELTSWPIARRPIALYISPVSQYFI